MHQLLVQLLLCSKAAAEGASERHWGQKVAQNCKFLAKVVNGCDIHDAAAGASPAVQEMHFSSQEGPGV